MKNIWIYVIGFLLLNNSCQEKKVKIKFEQRECKNLVLKNATYSLLKSPCDGNGQQQFHKENTIYIRIDHNNKESCLEFFTIKADFFRGDGTSIPVFPGVNYKDKYKASDPEVTLTDQYIQIAFNYTVPDGEETNLRTIKINLQLENELRDDPRYFSLTVPLNCIKRTATTNYNVVQDVYVNNSTVSIGFRDYSSIDGDIITVYLNGTPVLSNLTLTGTFQTFTFTVAAGQNDLVVVAENEGSSTPNTCQVKVNNGAGIDLTPGLLTGQGINIIF